MKSKLNLSWSWSSSDFSQHLCYCYTILHLSTFLSSVYSFQISLSHVIVALIIMTIIIMFTQVQYKQNHSLKKKIRPLGQGMRQECVGLFPHKRRIVSSSTCFYSVNGYFPTLTQAMSARVSKLTYFLVILLCTNPIFYFKRTRYVWFNLNQLNWNTTFYSFSSYCICLA